MSTIGAKARVEQTPLLLTNQYESLRRRAVRDANKASRPPARRKKKKNTAPNASRLPGCRQRSDHMVFEALEYEALCTGLSAAPRHLGRRGGG